MRCAIVLGEGKYADELGGYQREPGPRLEFIEIAKAINADVVSYTSAAANRGPTFRTLFGRCKKVGSAINVAMMASRYDRLYVTAEGVGLPLALLLRALRWKGKMACVFHNMSWASKKRVVSMLGHDMFCAFITVNDLQAQILTHECGMPPDKVLSVYNWVDTQFFRPQEVGHHPPEPYFMSCGAENRDYETLARAANRLEGRFAVFGHGFMASDVRAKSSAANLIYMPRVSYLELRDAYAASTIVIVPLNDVAYAAGVTGIIEGMSAGKPLIVTASRGIRQYVSAFDLDLIVPAKDDAALAAAIKSLSLDITRQRALGAQNRRFAADHFSVDKYASLVKERMLSL